MKRAASIKTLTTIKDVTPVDARAIRAAWLASPNSRQVRREDVNILLKTFGVEYLGPSRRTGESVYYCNAGDTYDTTILFIGDRLVVGDWGTLVERNFVRGQQ